MVRRTTVELKRAEVLTRSPSPSKVELDAEGLPGVRQGTWNNREER
jgi:hypothetical protein